MDSDMCVSSIEVKVDPIESGVIVLDTSRFALCDDVYTVFAVVQCCSIPAAHHDRCSCVSSSCQAFSKISVTIRSRRKLLFVHMWGRYRAAGRFPSATVVRTSIPCWIRAPSGGAVQLLALACRGCLGASRSALFMIWLGARDMKKRTSESNVEGW
jgi:hypothetical protein